jgi:hypothetical protein
MEVGRRMLLECVLEEADALVEGGAGTWDVPPRV